MAKVYVEARPKGQPAGSTIADFVVEDQADHVLHTSGTKTAAIEWSKRNGHEPHVARVRHLADKAEPTHWCKL